VSPAVVDDRRVARPDVTLLGLGLAAWLAAVPAPTAVRVAAALLLAVVTLVRVRLSGVSLATLPWRHRLEVLAGIPAFRALGASPIASRRLGIGVAVLLIAGASPW
jgi:hypothetical protein